MANITFGAYRSPEDEGLTASEIVHKYGQAEGVVVTLNPYRSYATPSSRNVRSKIRSSIRTMPKIKRMRTFFGADVVAPAPIVDVQVQPVNIEPPITPAVIPPTPTEQEPAKTSAETTAEPVKNDTPQQTSITPPPDTSLATEQPAAESVSLLPLAAVAIGAYLLLRG